MYLTYSSPNLFESAIVSLYDNSSFYLFLLLFLIFELSERRLYDLCCLIKFPLFCVW